MNDFCLADNALNLLWQVIESFLTEQLRLSTESFGFRLRHIWNLIGLITTVNLLTAQKYCL
jgi:hypothetical protein